MDLEALGNLGDFVGGVAVVVTLIYVAVQIRQNTSQVRLNTASTQYEGILHAFDPVYSGENGPTFLKGLAGQEDLTPDESFVFSLLMTRIFAQFEMSLYHRDRGSLEQDLFELHSRMLEVFAHSEGGARWWREFGVLTFGREFVEHIEQLMATPDSPFAVRAREAHERMQGAATS